MLSTVLKGNVGTASEISSRVKWNWNLGFGTSGQSKGIFPFGDSASANGSEVKSSSSKVNIFSFTEVSYCTGRRDWQSLSLAETIVTDDGFSVKYHGRLERAKYLSMVKIRIYRIE